MKYWGIWARERRDKVTWIWLTYVRADRYSKAKAKLLGQRLIKAWKMKNMIPDVQLFEGEADHPLRQPELFKD